MEPSIVICYDLTPIFPEFTYDPAGRRIRKISRSGHNGTSYGTTVDTKFLYDGWNLLAELDAGTGAVIRGYLWGSDLSGGLQNAGGVGGLLAVKDATEGAHFYPMDGNGNVAGTVKSDGTVTASYFYNPFLKITESRGVMSSRNPFVSSTKFADLESGNLYYGRRYYTPSTGTWLSRDPIEEDGGKHLYAQCANNTISRIDPFGLRWEKGLRTGQARQIWFRTSDLDTYEDLARIVKLDPSEIGQWLEFEAPEPGDHISGCNHKVSVPNTIIFEDLTSVPVFNSWLIGEISHFEQRGYKIVEVDDPDSTTINGHFGQRDLYGIVVIGHGVKENKGDIIASDTYQVNPSTVFMHHKLGGLKIAVCWSAAQGPVGSNRNI